MIATNTNFKAKNHSGRWLVVAMFVLAGATVLGFYRATRHFDPAPADAVWAKPTRPVRVAMFDLTGKPAQIDPTSVDQSDVILVRGINGVEVDAFARTLGMSQSPRAEVYYPGQNLDPEEHFGNAIFGRLPLYEGRSIPNKGGSFGVWAVAVVDGQKFMLASIALSKDSANELTMLKRAWKELGSPPMIVGGDWADEKAESVQYWGW